MRKISRMLLGVGLIASSQLAFADYSLPGTYEMTISDDYSESGAQGAKTLSVTIAPNGDGYVLKDLSGDYFPTDIKFNFDPATNMLTFSPYSVGNLDGITGEASFTAYTTNRWQDEFTYGENVTVPFDPETGLIKPEGYVGFCWLSTESITWNYPDIAAKYDFNSAQWLSSDLGEGDAPKWKDVGEALFMDGWVLPMLGIDQKLEANQWKVPLQQSTENEKIYRLVDPYHVAGTPAAEANLSVKTGYIEFDVTDPDHVLFNKVEAGFAYNDPKDGEKKFNEFYCMNFLGYFHLQYPNMSLATLTSPIYGNMMSYTTFDNGVVSLGYKDFGDGDISYDAHYGTENKPVCSGYWYYEDDNYRNIPLDMTARIVFPGSTPVDPDIEDPKGDDEPTEAPTYVGSVSAVHSQTLEGVTKEYPFTFDYEITYNADKTLTLGGHFTFTDGEPVAYDGSSLMIIFPGGYVNNDANQTDLFTTTGYSYEEGQTVDIQFANAVAAGRVEANVKYVVGSVSEGSDQPGGELPTSGKYNGNVSADLDEMLGMEEEPQLSHADWTVTADFDADSNTLTIYNLAESEYPIVFDVDVTAGTLKSKGAQLSNKEEIDEDMTIEYYYADFKSKSYDVNGTFKNADGNCEISLNPWGEALPEYDFFFNTLWYNTVITIEDLTIGQQGGNDEPAEGDITGNMVYQIDMNMGQEDEPNLADPDDCQVTASYDEDSKTLVIYGMFDGLNPLKLTVDPAAGTFSGAVPQISSVDDYEPDYILTYYYIDFNNHELAASGTIANVNDKCVLEFAPLGECMPEYDYFFNFLWYNTVVTLDFNISGAEEKEEKGDITGNMVYQVDMNMGTGEEPDLTEPEEVTVTASYDAESGKLTIYNFAEMNPVVFDVNVTAGTIFADEQQVAYTESFEGQDFIYYYGDVTSMEQGMNGTIRNISETQCELRVDPWGEAMAYAGSVFFNTAFYNTVVILDLNIEGLAYKPQISITEEGVTAEVTDSGVVLTIPYDEKYLPLNPTIYAEVKIKGSEEMNVYPVTANPGVITVQGLDAGYYVFEITLIVEDGGKNKVAESDVFETSVVTVETGIDAVGADKEAVRYFNLQGIEIAAPEKGTFVKVQGNKATKVLVK